MSYSIHLEALRMVEVYSSSMTSNVGFMWQTALRNVLGRESTDAEREEAGRLGLLVSLTGAQAAKACADAAAHIRANPEMYKPMEPGNGWGDMAGAARFLAELGEAYTKDPDAKLRVNR